jgi:hypothetical protein
MKRKLVCLLVICSIIWTTTNPVITYDDNNPRPITILRHGEGTDT